MILFYLFIHVAPPTFILSPSNMTGVVGSLVSFQCTASGFPPPKITWILIDLIADDIQISNITLSEYIVSSNITIILNIEDKIWYTNPVKVKCEAFNELVEESVAISKIGVLIYNCKFDIVYNYVHIIV